MELRIIEISKANRFDASLVGAAYALWVQTYTPIVAAAGRTLSPESFHRSQFVTMICEGQRVLSFALSSHFDMSIPGVSDMAYFSPMSDGLKAKFIRENPKVMTIEWVTVDPAERERVSKIRQPDLIMGCCFKRFALTDADVAMGFSRVDYGADRIAAQYGCEPQEDTSMFNIACKVMMVRRHQVKSHRFAVVQSAVDRLWDPQPIQTAA